MVLERTSPDTEKSLYRYVLEAIDYFLQRDKRIDVGREAVVELRREKRMECAMDGKTFEATSAKLFSI